MSKKLRTTPCLGAVETRKAQPVPLACFGTPRFVLARWTVYITVYVLSLYVRTTHLCYYLLHLLHPTLSPPAQPYLPRLSTNIASSIAVVVTLLCVAAAQCEVTYGCWPRLAQAKVVCGQLIASQSEPRRKEQGPSLSTALSLPPASSTQGRPTHLYHRPLSPPTRHHLPSFTTTAPLPYCETPASSLLPSAPSFPPSTSTLSLLKLCGFAGSPLPPRGSRSLNRAPDSAPAPHSHHLHQPHSTALVNKHLHSIPLPQHRFLRTSA